MIEVIRFYADWCGPCKMLKPIMENVKSKSEGVSFKSYDVDKDYEIAQKYGIRSIPVVVLEKDGVEIERFSGLQSELAYTNAINEAKK